jgi:rRNA biogenesis protein RRP5
MKVDSDNHVIQASIRQASPDSESSAVNITGITIGGVAGGCVSLSKKNALSIDTVEIGQAVVGRVIRHNQHGSCIKLSSRLNGILHPTDASDNYEAGVPYPSTDTVLKCVIIGIDRSKNSVALSTRRSKLYPSQNEEVVDRDIQNLNDLKKGDTVRGFIKNVAHGLFVTLGRDIDARVQIKELFNEVSWKFVSLIFKFSNILQYVKDWKARFTLNQLVTGRILEYVTFALTSLRAF